MPGRLDEVLRARSNTNRSAIGRARMMIVTVRSGGLAIVLGCLAGTGAAQEAPDVTPGNLVRFLTMPGPDHRLDVAGVRAKILAREIGGRVNGPLTSLLSQPIQPAAAPVLVRALEAAWYAPIDVPEPVLLKYLALRPGAIPGLDAATIGDLRLRALVALAYRPRPQLDSLWEQLWASEQDPVFLQFVLTGAACTGSDGVKPMLANLPQSRLLSEVAERLTVELSKGDSALVCAGGESTRAEAFSSPPVLRGELEVQGRTMLLRAGLAR